MQPQRASGLYVRVSARNVLFVCTICIGALVTAVASHKALLVPLHDTAISEQMCLPCREPGGSHP